MAHFNHTAPTPHSELWEVVVVHSRYAEASDAILPTARLLFRLEGEWWRFNVITWSPCITYLSLAQLAYSKTFRLHVGQRVELCKCAMFVKSVSHQLTLEAYRQKPRVHPRFLPAAGPRLPSANTCRALPIGRKRGQTGSGQRRVDTDEETRQSSFAVPVWKCSIDLVQAASCHMHITYYANGFVH